MNEPGESVVSGVNQDWPFLPILSRVLVVQDLEGSRIENSALPRVHRDAVPSAIRKVEAGVVPGGRYTVCLGNVVGPYAIVADAIGLEDDFPRSRTFGLTVADVGKVVLIGTRSYLHTFVAQAADMCVAEWLGLLVDAVFVVDPEPEESA